MHFDDWVMTEFPDIAENICQDTCGQTFFKKKIGQPRPLWLFIFGLFKKRHYNVLQLIYVKNVRPVYGAGIRTHDLRNVSRLP